LQTEWLHLLSYATPIQARAEAGGGTRVDFTVDVPDEASDFGVRGLSGTGWFKWDGASGTLREVSFDLIYRELGRTGGRPRTLKSALGRNRQVLGPIFIYL
jgi:hypothetical protein